MNVAFVVDTSLSMSQVFDKQLSFLDSAKSAIEKFVQMREATKKLDKYFLFTTSVVASDDPSSNETKCLSGWKDPSSHFRFQLKTLRIS